jgi:hypothetical protein
MIELLEVFAAAFFGVFFGMLFLFMIYDTIGSVLKKYFK